MSQSLTQTNIQLEERVYSANADKTSLVKGIILSFKGLYDGRYLGYRLFVRNMKAQYRQSLLGLVWVFIPVVVTSLTWIMLQGSKVINVSETDIPYPAFVLIGTTLWQGFVGFLQMPLQSVNANKSLLVKINFNREALLVTAFYEAGFNFLIRLPVIAIALILFKIELGINLIYFPLTILSLFILGSAISLMLLPIGMLYGDIARGISVLAPFLMYLTPIIYPFPKSGLAATLMGFNPVAPIVSSIRNTFGMASNPLHESFWLITLVASVIFIFGLIVYRKSMPHIIARIGA